MQKKHEPPLQVELKASSRLTQLLIVMHVLAMGSSLANALPLEIKFILLLGIVIHLLVMLKQLNVRQYTLKQTEAFGWELSDGKDFEPIHIQNSTVITTFALFLHFNKNTKRQSLLILNDSLTDEDYRRLIVRLKTADQSVVR